jgi:release factor glutamine methyltransferase
MAATLPRLLERRHQASDRVLGGDIPRAAGILGALSTHLELVSRLRVAGCVFAEDEARLLLAAAATAEDLERLVRRRVGGEPLEYVLGWAEFCGLRIVVEPGVFVPRRRTEFLVEQAVELARSGDIVVDLCCGSGAIAAALAAAVDGLELYATDLDPVAVRCATRNLERTDLVYAGDLYEPLPAALRGRVDLVVCNAPYVPTNAIDFMPAEARLHETRSALDGGPDGLDIQRRVAAEAPSWLAPAGHLLIETSVDQAPLTRAAFEEAGLTATIAHSAELEATVVVGQRPSPEADA